jgi:hypothetical protein
MLATILISLRSSRLLFKNLKKKRSTRRLHIETIAAKAPRIFISICPLLKIEPLNVGKKLTLYKALIRSVLTYSCPAWEFAADRYLSKLQRLQTKDLRTTCNLPRRIPTRDLHMAFKILYLYDFATKIRREQITVIRNHENFNIRNTGQGEARRRKYKRL